MKETYNQAKARLSKSNKRRSPSFVKMFDPTDENAHKEIAELRRVVSLINKTVHMEYGSTHKTLTRIVTEYRLPKEANHTEAKGYHESGPHYKREDAVLGFIYIQKRRVYKVA
jgi:hypothetical protein